MRLNQFLPEYHFSEYHSVTVKAPPEIVFKAIKQVDMSDSSLIKGLLALRLLPYLFKPEKKPDFYSAIALDDFIKMGFIKLADIFPDEMILGLAGQFWKPTVQLRAIPPGRFRQFNRPGFCKAVWNIQVRSNGAAGSLLSTTTRIYCLGLKARVLFTCYWSVIRPFSGLIRKILLPLPGPGDSVRLQFDLHAFPGKENLRPAGFTGVAMDIGKRIQLVIRADRFVMKQCR